MHGHNYEWVNERHEEKFLRIITWSVLGLKNFRAKEGLDVKARNGQCVAID